MEFKPDWEFAKGLLTDWWRGAGLALSVYAPRKKPFLGLPEPKLLDDPKECWLDAEFRIRSSECAFDHTFYGGTAFPDMNLYLGPGCMALYLGCEGDFSKCEGTFSGQDTIWFYPFIDDPDKAPDLRFDPENYYWKRHIGIIKLALERGAGRYQVSIPALVNNLDMLAYLRDATQVFIDLLDRPEWVHKCQRQMLELYFRYYEEIYDLVKEPNGGCSYNGFQVWAPGRITRAGVDLGAMISPEMYREFVLPYVEEECNRVDYAIFHLDGPECIRHLDALLEIDTLHAIQWSPTGVSCGSEQWYPLYKKIRDAGKSLQLRGIKPEEVQPLIDRFGPDGLNIWVTLDSEDNARRLLDKYYS
ncbi:MAG: hypothetical protein PVG14_00610 [Anaerolineales bacterium]|jgi:hypothetical protein